MDYIVEPDQLIKSVHQCFAQEEYTKAEQLLDEFIQNDQSDPEVYKLRADCYLKLGKYIQALHDMERAMLLDPTIECCKSSLEHYQIKKGLMRMSNDI